MAGRAVGIAAEKQETGKTSSSNRIERPRPQREKVKSAKNLTRAFARMFCCGA